MDEKQEKKNEIASFPIEIKYLNDFMYFTSKIGTLNLENSKIISIGRYAFAHCFHLQNITFPSSLEEICEGAFMCCCLIENIQFSLDSNLNKIGAKAFRNCINMVNIEFPPRLELIGDYAFKKCEKIKKFDLSSTSIKYMGIDVIPYDLYGMIIFKEAVKPISFVNRCSFDDNIEENQVVKRGSSYFFVNGKAIAANRWLKRFLIRDDVRIISSNFLFFANLVSVTIPASVVEIDKFAFQHCRKLKLIRFAKDSLLKVIRSDSFSGSQALKSIKLPKSLRSLEFRAFANCYFLEKVVFPKDSQLEKIEPAFQSTSIKHLMLPQSVREITNVTDRMKLLETISVDNDQFQSNREKNAVFSKDGKELFFVNGALRSFEIPDSVRVIKRRAFYGSKVTEIMIPASVEIIEDEAFRSCDKLKIVKFAEDSKLRSLGVEAFPHLENLIINNESFITRSDGVIISQNPKGIVFVPKQLTEIEVDHDVEVIHSFAFYGSKIKNIKLPKSMKRICFCAFCRSRLESVTFEDGTELDFIHEKAFSAPCIKCIEFPQTKEVNFPVTCDKCGIIKFPPNFNPKTTGKPSGDSSLRIICPRSSLLAVVRIFPYNKYQKKWEILDN